MPQILFTHFEKHYHSVDLGSGYLNDSSASEMMKYIAISTRMNNITEPLNSGAQNYYSVLFDGGSSSKCLDEKELFVLTTCAAGTPKFVIASLEEPEECNAPGIKASMGNSIDKMGFTFERKNKEIGMCSDSAAINRAVYNLLRDELGNQYLLMLCPSHKFELAIAAAFQPSALNTVTEKCYNDVYYLFKKAPLRWRLLKRQALFQGIKQKRYKRLCGTRWVEHRVAARDGLSTA